ncbi:uncharacterized protein A4U43_C03F25730 [Asparagus officinalis]|uniref:Uncharacterized protein n=1 Tax=Asparagus officinalis TaxID=4686 RepID=A0A5P1FFS4_ASPOF|nr:uncharacterized protein A4U43_C03F25730 [Asparagus officinalis]
MHALRQDIHRKGMRQDTHRNKAVTRLHAYPLPQHGYPPPGQGYMPQGPPQYVHPPPQQQQQSNGPSFMQGWRSPSEPIAPLILSSHSLRY